MIDGRWSPARILRFAGSGVTGSGPDWRTLLHFPAGCNTLLTFCLGLALGAASVPGCRSPRQVDRTAQGQEAPGVRPAAQAGLRTSPTVRDDPHAPGSAQTPRVSGSPVPPSQPGCTVSLATAAGPIDCRLLQCPSALGVLTSADSVTARPDGDGIWLLEAGRSAPPMAPEPSVRVMFQEGSWTIEAPSSPPELQLRAGCTGPAAPKFASPFSPFPLEGILVRKTF